jgi:hypothetical protein
LALCNKLVVLVVLVPLLAEYFELALVLVFYDSDSHLFYDCYGTLQRLIPRREQKPIRTTKLEILKNTFSK